MYEEGKDTLHEVTIESYNNAFEVEFTHNSTAIEGNTLTLMETKVVLEDGISIGGKALREKYEVVNHKKAFRYVKQCTKEGLPLSEKIVKDIHNTGTEPITSNTANVTRYDSRKYQAYRFGTFYDFGEKTTVTTVIRKGLNFKAIILR